MPQIAVLNADGVITAVSDVDQNLWITDKTKNSVQLPDAHDMKGKIGEYYYDFELNSFMPVAIARDDLDEIIDVLCEIVTQLCEKCHVRPSQSASDIMHKWLSAPR